MSEKVWIGYEGLLLELLPFGDEEVWNAGKSLSQAWNECERANWMLGMCGIMVGKPGWPTHKQIVSVAITLAHSVIHFIHGGEERPRLAIEAAEAWVENPTEENSKKATDAADASHDAYYANIKVCNHAGALASDACASASDACVLQERVALYASNAASAVAYATAYSVAYEAAGATDADAYEKVNKAISPENSAVWDTTHIKMCDMIRDTLVFYALKGEVKCR